MGQIVARQSGQSFYQFIINNLFEPLGITQHDAWMFRGDLHAGSGLYLTLRGMAKFGQMYLDDGRWLGQQVVPAAWVRESTQQYVQQGSIRYGYQWWLTTFQMGEVSIESFSANGWGGQLIYVLPDLNAVVVMTGHRFEDGQGAETDVRVMMEQFILPFINQ